MSRIGKKTILIPEGVEVKLENGNIIVKGPKGEIKREIHPAIKVEIKEKEIVVRPFKKIKKVNALWGLFRSLIFNMVEGVVKGFEKKLELEGVGYKANLQEKDIILNIGFSHPVKIDAVEGIDFLIERNVITVSGVDKEKVGQIAATIRLLKPAEPYKGKGIKYQGEKIRRKEGKKASVG